ncbi:Hypothetical protein, putative [Bodo saltans]|uniref:Uncharacterized protein n=1 Tax=Bodo saltans TaxID=75058 RepID=A0A0S4JP34_BODSA|nr:Hypothetical protein, putative [Bodo saltans]|eukprot:CUG91102.1 Hypothetical protein, putative [Bodo saltans]
MVQGRLVGLKSAEALPSSVVVSQDGVNDVNRVLALIPDAAAVSQVLTDYLIAHGENSEDDAKTMTFDLGKHLFAKLNPRNVETEAALRQAFSQAHLAIASNDDGDGHDDGMSVSPKFSNQDDSSLSLLVHPCGSIRRAVATGFAVRLLVGLKPTKSSDVALSRLQPQALLANTFYVGNNGHYSVDEAVKAASKRLHVSVTNLPDSEFFDIAEGVVLYNPSHYWSLMTTCDIPLRQDDESTPTDGGTDAEGKPVRLMALWRSRWFVALELVRRLLYARDYGAFFVGSPFLLLSGRFSMEVPEFPLLKLEDRQGNIFEAILNRVDRVTVQKFGAFLQRAVAKGSIEYAVRQAKVAGVIRAIGEAIGSIRTPIKTVDLCLQTLTIIAQNVRCHRPQSLFFHELFPSGFAGDLMEHGFVTASGRSDDSLGLPIPSLITKNFLHRRDAWAVLSHLHPTFVHINERLVQEACRRALPQHFLSQENANPKQHNSQADESSPTHYRSSDDLFMIASAMVILSHATTNVNARRNQLSNLRPCIAQLIAGILETLRSGHTKIPGWVSQQTRLALSSIRIVKAVLEDWIAESKETTGLDAASDTKPKVTSPIYPTLLADICRVIDAAPLLSSLTSTALQVVELLIQESLSNDLLSLALSSGKVDTDTAGNPFAPIVATIQRRFLDVGFDDDCNDHTTTLTDVTIKDDIVKSVLSILLTICLKLNNIGDAGSVAISLGVHQCHDWGLELVAAINNGGVPTPSSLLEVTGDRATNNNSAAAPAPTKQRSETDDHATSAAAPTTSFVASQSWKQLAASSHAVYVELFDRCDVTSIAAAASALGQLLKLQPELSISFEHLFSRSTLWLGKPIYELLEGEERRLEAELGEEGKGLINTSRNAILCGFLELVKTFVSSPTVASDDATVPALCALVLHFRQDVPYLNHLLQALLNAVSNGAKKSAYHPHRTLLRSVADASKTSGKLSTKLFAILDDKEKKQKSSGKETTQNEASATNPSLAGFAIIARSVSASKKPIIAKEDSARKIIRSSLSKAKDAQRSDEAGRKKRAAAEQAEERQNNNANYSRGAPYNDQQQQQQRQSTRASEAAPRAEEIAAVNGRDAKGNTKKMVSMRGDDGGINLDLLTLRIAQKQKTTTDTPQERPAKPTSWANVAKSAKTIEEREDEANRAAAAEEERLQKAAAERAVRRKAAQEEEKRNQQDSDRRYRLEEEVKRNRGAIDVVDDFSSRPSPSTVDVHALLNMVLTAPGSVIRKAPAAEPQRQQASVIPRLTTVDDEEVGLGTVPSLSANAAIASLAQLRLGTEGSTVVHRAAYTSATVQQAPPHQQQTPPQQSPLNALLQAPNYAAHQQPPHHYQQQAQQLQSQLPPPPPQSLSKDSSMPSYFTTATNPTTTNREVDGSIWHAEASLGAGYSTGQHHHAGVPSLQQQRVAPPSQQQQQQHIFPTPHHHHHHHHIPQQQQRGQFEEWGVQSAAPPTTAAGGARRSPPAQGNPWAHIPPPQQQQSQLPFPQSSNSGFPLGGGGQHHHHHHYSNSVAPPPSFTQQQQHQHSPSTSLFHAPPSSSSYTTSVMAPPPSHLQQQQQRQPHQVPPPHPQQQQQRVWLPGMNPQGGQSIAPPVRDIRVGGAPPNGIPPGVSPYGGGAGPNGAPLHHMPPHQPPQPSVSVGFQNLSQQRPALPTTVTVGGRQAGAPWPPMSQPAPGFPQQVPSITIGGRAPPTAATLQQLPLSQPPQVQGVRVGHSQNGGDSAPAPNPYASATTTGNFGF